MAEPAPVPIKDPVPPVAGSPRARFGASSLTVLRTCLCANRRRGQAARLRCTLNGDIYTQLVRRALAHGAAIPSGACR